MPKSFTPSLPAKARAALAALAAGALLVGCSSTPPRPDWVSNPYVGHAQSEYVAAVGRGGSMSAAEADATTGVAKQVAREIDHQTIDLEEYETRVKAGGFDPAETIELLELGEFDETRRPLGFDIAERHEEVVKKKPTKYFALGVVDRDEVSRAYETQMRRNSSFGNQMIARAESEPVTARKLAALRAALATAEVFRDLRYIRDEIGDAGYAGDDSLAPPRKTVDELNAEIAAIRNSIAASIEVRDGRSVPDPIAAEIRSALQKAGVPVRTDRGEGHIRVLVDWDVENVNQTREDMVMVNYRLSVELVEDDSGFSLASRYWDTKEGGRDQVDAENNALRIARRDAARELPEFIRESLFEASLNNR